MLTKASVCIWIRKRAPILLIYNHRNYILRLQLVTGSQKAIKNDGDPRRKCC